MNAALPQPPFGQQIDQAHDLVMIYCGRRAWELAKPEGERVASLVFPRGRDPAEFNWPVRGRQVAVFVLAEGPKQGEIDLLVVELLRAGARRVHVRWDGEDGCQTYDPKPR